MALTSTVAPPLAARVTARASRRSTSPRSPITWRWRGCCSSAALTRRSRTHSMKARLQAGPGTSAPPECRRCFPPDAMPEENPLDLIRKRTIVYRVPEMDAVSVRRDVEYLSAPGERRTLDLYLPTHQESRNGLPALVFVMGYPDAGMKAMLGCPAKEIGQYTSWARLAAASGMIGVTYSAQEPASETLAVLRYLRENARSLNLDPHRIGIWSCSGNVPNA